MSISVSQRLQLQMLNVNKIQLFISKKLYLLIKKCSHPIDKSEEGKWSKIRHRKKFNCLLYHPQTKVERQNTKAIYCQICLHALIRFPPLLTLKANPASSKEWIDKSQGGAARGIQPTAKSLNNEYYQMKNDFNFTVNGNE